MDDFSSSSSDTTTTESTDSELGDGPTPGQEAAQILESQEYSECLPSCEPGFECVKGQCESKCQPPCEGSSVCTDSGVCERLGVVKEHMDEAADRRTQHRRDTTLTGVRAIGGILVGGGFTLHSYKERDGDGLDDPSSHGAFYAAIKAGVMFEIAELSAEWSPKLYKPVAMGRKGVLDRSTFIHSLIGQVGVHIPMTDMVYWPIRVGGGFIANDGRLDFQAKVDPFNLSIKTRYLLLEASFPSLRYMSDFDDYHRWTALVTLGANYISP